MTFTLDDYILLLESYDPNTKVEYGLAEGYSWRGSYDELAFSPCGTTTIAEMCQHAYDAEGSIQRGYKGGHYFMNTDTPIHIDPFGCYNADLEDMRQKIIDMIEYKSS